MTKVLACIVSAAVVSSAFAGSLSLHDAIVSSLVHCPANEAAAAAVQTQSANVEAVRSPLLPQLSAAGQGTIAGGPTSSGQNPIKDPQSQFYAGLALSQTILDFGKTPAKLRSAHRGFDAARFDSAYSAQTIILSTIQAYCAVLSANDRFNAAKDAFDAAQKHSDLARAQLANGKGTKYGIAAADYTLANAKLADECLKV